MLNGDETVEEILFASDILVPRASNYYLMLRCEYIYPRTLSNN